MIRPFIIVSVVTAVLYLGGIAHEAGAGTKRSRPVRTGQITCWNAAGDVINCTGTGQDGELRRGEPRAYQDNGDGTIRDQRTALVWEKLSDDGSIHDKDSTYTWAQAFGKINDLNTEPCFAGFCDWRLPNSFELYSLVNLGTAYPAVSAAFNTGCAPGCAVLTCSCIVSLPYWSSSSHSVPSFAHLILFDEGLVSFGLKSGKAYARAVRAGS